ncbi:MAG: phosphate ABC transporter substrate-binding protein [Candidatus Sedimenticola sp. 6PFRAG7]
MKSTLLKLLPFLLISYSVNSTALTLSWVGCGITKKAFMAELASAYKIKTGTDITLEGGGATKGIRSVTDKTADIGGSCRYRIKGETPEATVRFSPVAWDALVVAVHKSNPIDSISLDQLRQVYLGKISNWKELGGEDRPLELLTRKGKISGVGLTIRQLVFGDDQMTFPDRYVYKSSGPLEQAIEQNPNAIGMSGISSARKRDFKIIKLDGKSPSFENIKSGEYLLYRPLYIITDRQNENTKELDKFIGFAHSKEGRSIIRRNGVVPYLEAVRLSMKQREQWQRARQLKPVKPEDAG